MSTYTILGQTVEFSPAADRFCKLQFFAWEAARKAAADFDTWYIKCGEIHAVLDSYWTEVKKVVVQHIITPLYNTLSRDYQVYNVSAEAYRKSCLDLSEAYDVYEMAVDIYNNIIDQLEEEREYREYRKASRAEVIGGGFGLGGALKGMATAGAINMATGAAHSIANAIGNASSEGDATERKKELYREAREPFRDAVERCVLATAYQHIEVVNSYSDKQITSCFDREQSSALFESAMKVPGKRDQLLVESFTLCPWFYKIYPYIFKNYPNERKNIITISKDFHYDLTKEIDELLGQEYTAAAKKSETLAQEAKSRIKAIMLELGITESVVIDQIESDCLARICHNLAQASEEKCNVMLQTVKAYDALPKNKQSYIDQINARIEAIWAKEDGDIFDNYLLQLDILNPQAVKEGIAFVKTRGRTDDKKKYLNALESFNYKKIKFTRWYRFCANPGILGIIIKYIGFAVALYGLYQFVDKWEWSFWTQIFPMVAGIGWECFIFFGLKESWDLMTINGKVIHPVLTVSNAKFEQMYATTMAKHQQTSRNSNDNITSASSNNPNVSTSVNDTE